MTKRIRPKEIIRQRNRRLAAVTFILLLSVFFYLAYWWHVEKGWVSTDDAFVAGHLVTVKSQTEGTVVEILAENTQAVTHGQLLARLDGIRALIDLQRAQAELAETVRNIVTLKAGIETQKTLAKEAELNQIKHDLARYLGGVKEGAVSVQQVQNTQDKINELKSTIAALITEKSGIEAQIQGVSVDTHPSVEKAKSQVRQAYLAYHRRNILAPISGVVANRKVQVGDSVKEGTSLMVIIPLDDLWIEANFLETQVKKIRPGQSADITVDAYGDEIIYHGNVQGITPGTGSSFAFLPTDNATGNFIHIAERVPVRISLDLKELQDNPLQPGLSTVTRINTTTSGDSVFSSHVKATGNAYRTSIFEHELDDVEALINNIINSNI
jgi:membrane fusion protein, multidrug efflux system